VSGPPYDYKVLIAPPDAAAPCECHDCGWYGAFADLAEIESCSLTPGDPSPAGRCPRCDTLAYIIKRRNRDARYLLPVRQLP
jgi:hypothetical protein